LPKLTIATGGLGISHSLSGRVLQLLLILPILIWKSLSGLSFILSALLLPKHHVLARDNNAAPDNDWV
jgi:hypothetical protein